VRRKNLTAQKQENGCELDETFHAAKLPHAPAKVKRFLRGTLERKSEFAGVVANAV
jgi:hypothetical protein